MQCRSHGLCTVVAMAMASALRCRLRRDKSPQDAGRAKISRFEISRRRSADGSEVLMAPKC